MGGANKKQGSCYRGSKDLAAGDSQVYLEAGVQMQSEMGLMEILLKEQLLIVPWVPSSDLSSQVTSPPHCQGRGEVCFLEGRMIT